MTLLEWSNAALIVALLLYTAAFIAYMVAVIGKTWRNRVPEMHQKKWGWIGFTISTLGLAGHLVFYITRWIHIGHVPVSNLFEFMTFLALMTVIAYSVIFLIYRTPMLGMIVMPLAIIVLGYAAVFPWDPVPLQPALEKGDKRWLLGLHVSTAAAGEAFFAIGFAGGLMYLLRTVRYGSTDKKAKREQRALEFTLLTVCMLIGFIASSLSFSGAGYEAVFTKQEEAVETTIRYTLPPIVQPNDAQLQQMDTFIISEPLFEAPSWLKGVNAGRKLNTVIWSILLGLILYGMFRLITRKPLGAAIQPYLKDLDPEDLNEISYRAIAIGFPIFTLGGLIFAMIWAHYAWGRFWGFDPKETWALITWLFYSAYLHFRLSRGWQGKPSSWLAVIGFVIVMFTLIGVNLVIAGLHSYSGV
ncbi:c-type cytochrome biogenesis protein CcsB [Marinicrinis lubricantis]|uniref:C-type cytochrome biogenesis protein CcsB n=1 Tax=Marinicrinis lubricantis TaxID=2086470 RepID=A0ABW1ISL9_9BACL